MYQAPAADRTDAWKPSGVTSARIVAVGSSRPVPRYVLMSGCFAARPGSITGESTRAKRWNWPFGAGRLTVSPESTRPVDFSRGAPASSEVTEALSRAYV